MPPRRRSTSIRRPRVAGTAPGPRPDPGLRPAAVDTVDARPTRPRRELPPRVRPVPPAGDEPVDDVEELSATAGAPPETADPDAVPAAVAAPRAGFLRARAVPVLAALLIVLLTAATTFGILDHRLRSTPAAQNTALVDLGATAEASGQLGDALETLYSFDFARLDENERAIRDVITPAFGPQFDVIWADVRELAPQLEAVVTATVSVAAVKTIDGDRAELVAFVDQQATRVAEGAQTQQLASAGRITVVGERVDGRWKIADILIR